MFRKIDAECYIMVDGNDTYPAEAAPEMVRNVLEKTAIWSSAIALIMWFGVNICHGNYKLIKIISTAVVMVFNFVTKKLTLSKK